MKSYLVYPVREGNISTILFPAFLIVLSRIFSHVMGWLLGSYASIVGYIFIFLILGFSGGYLTQIVRSAAGGNKEPPQWTLDKVDISESLKGFFPLAFSIVEGGIIWLLLLLLYVVVSDFSFIQIVTDKISLIILTALSSIFIPLNLLAYGVNKDFDIRWILSSLDRNKSIKLLLFSAVAVILGLLALLPLWNRLYSTFLAFSFIFYCAQIYSYALGKIYYHR